MLKRSLEKGDTWSEQLLHRFDRTSSDGGNPMAGLVFDSDGNLYGTTLNGGPGPGGTVFRLTPPSKETGRWKETILHGFNGHEGGYAPQATLILDQTGALYGTTYFGSGGDLQGSVFRLKPPRPKDKAWTINFLWGFTDHAGGLFPSAALVFDSKNNLYATTQQGGTRACPGGCGTVFEVSP
jgi:uncharacterized repeat protein (TIGR03803 family)